MSKNASNRIDGQPCYILTSFPWKESSLWVEIFSRDYGRLPLVARSARKPNSVLRGTLLPFAPLVMSWYGQNELRTLHTANWQGGMPQPYGKDLLSGFYVNELLLKLTIRDDIHTELFDEYEKVIRALCFSQPLYQILRLFEWRLLKMLGFAPDITQEEEGESINPEGLYLMKAESSPQICGIKREGADGVVVLGQSLIDLHFSQIESLQTRQDILNLNRFLLNHRIPEGLASRRLLGQLNGSAF